MLGLRSLEQSQRFEVLTQSEVVGMRWPGQFEGVARFEPRKPVVIGPGCTFSDIAADEGRACQTPAQVGELFSRSRGHQYDYTEAPSQKQSGNSMIGNQNTPDIGRL